MSLLLESFLRFLFLYIQCTFITKKPCVDYKPNRLHNPQIIEVTLLNGDCIYFDISVQFLSSCVYLLFHRTREGHYMIQCSSRVSLITNSKSSLHEQRWWATDARSFLVALTIVRRGLFT